MKIKINKKINGKDDYSEIDVQYKNEHNKGHILIVDNKHNIIYYLPEELFLGILPDRRS